MLLLLPPPLVTTKKKKAQSASWRVILTFVCVPSYVQADFDFLNGLFGAFFFFLLLEPVSACFAASLRWRCVSASPSAMEWTELAAATAARLRLLAFF
jgi:hypothetical protein